MVDQGFETINKQRDVYNDLRIGELDMKQRIEGLEFYDNVAVLFSDLGNVIPFEMSFGDKVSWSLEIFYLTVAFL